MNPSPILPFPTCKNKAYVAGKFIMHIVMHFLSNCPSKYNHNENTFLRHFQLHSEQATFIVLQGIILIAS